tara:strand:- start:1668 stop:2219 length:552 start_codon:yes stop_codon:yes gene_type:complete
MKKSIIILLLIPLVSFSQEKVQKVEVVKSDTQIEVFTSSLGNNEIRVDFLDFIVFPALTIAYEKSNNSNSGFGSTLFINLAGEDDLGDDYNDKLLLTPYYRFYFLQSEDFGGDGIFAEIFTQFSSGKIAPGLAVGRKWINRKGFTFELLAGFGRNLLYDSDNDEYSNRTEGVARLGISIGKRF